MVIVIASLDITMSSTKGIYLESDSKLPWRDKYRRVDSYIIKYWIEYRVDEDRYWYGEYKPILIDAGGKKLYRYNTSLHHTKNGLDDSIQILEDICSRCNRIYDINEMVRYNSAMIDKLTDLKYEDEIDGYGIFL